MAAICSCSNLPLSSYRISPLYFSISHFSPINIGRCHTAAVEFRLPNSSPSSSLPKSRTGVSPPPLPFRLLSAAGHFHHLWSVRRGWAFFSPFLFLAHAAAQSPMTAATVHVKRTKACWVESFHLSSKFHRASMGSNAWLEEGWWSRSYILSLSLLVLVIIIIFAF